MSIDQGAEDVTVSVEFAGISLFVIHPQRQTVHVLVPTTDPRDVSTKHEDGDTGARHVPYLLMDLANLDQRVTQGLVADGPQFEVVRRLRREELFFEPEEPESIRLDPAPLPLPDLTVYKDRVRLKGGLLSNIPPDEPRVPPNELTARTILRGGTLAATTVGGSGKGNGSHGRDWDKYEVDWAGSIKWTRTIKMVPEKDFLTIRIHNWDTDQETPITLRPITRSGRKVIELKIAHLCEDNPLEWREFEPRFERDDVDFKWLFRLLEAGDGGSLLEVVGRKRYFGLGSKKFPYPKLALRGARTTGDAGCTPGQFTFP